MTRSRMLVLGVLLTAATAGSAHAQAECATCTEQSTTVELLLAAAAPARNLFGQPYEGPNTIEGKDPDEAALAEFIREIRAESERQQARAAEARRQAEAAEEAAPARAGDAPSPSQATSIQELLEFIENGPPVPLE